MKKTLLGLVVALGVVATAATAQAQTACGTGPNRTVSSADTVLNTYYGSPANATANAGTTAVPVSGVRGAAPVVAGDLVLVIQMQGAEIQTGQENIVGGIYGDGPGGGERRGAFDNANFIAGQYEFNIAAGAPSGGSIPMQFPLSNTYSARSTVAATSGGAGRSVATYQVVRVPQFNNLTVTASGEITPEPWNGRSGGIVVLDVGNQLNVSGAIRATGLGFRGGSPIIPTVFDDPQDGVKGEGIAGSPNRMFTQTLGVTTGPLGIFGGQTDQGAPGNGGGTHDLVIIDSGGGGGGGGGNAAAGSAGQDGAGTGGVGGDARDGRSLGCLSNFSQSWCGGSGGGGGAGAGGAGGGALLLVSTVSLDLSNGPIVSRGGDGADGGGGGAGGSIIIGGPEVQLSTVDLAGGSGGDVGGAGSPGRLRVDSARLTFTPGDEDNFYRGPAVDVLAAPAITNDEMVTFTGIAEPGTPIIMRDIVNAGPRFMTTTEDDGTFSVTATLTPGLNRFAVEADVDGARIRSWAGNNVEFGRLGDDLRPLPLGATVDVAYVPL